MRKLRKVQSSFQRKEDIRHITGKGLFLDDIQLPQMAHCAFVRSLHPRARLVRVDTERAKSAPGVVTVLIAEGLSKIITPPKIVVESTRLPIKYKPLDLLPLASGYVSYVGQPVAIVVASNKYLAEDAAELVEVEYEPLEPITNIEQALRPGSDIVYESWGSNLYFEALVGTGDVDSALRGSDHVFKETLKVHRHTAVPLETRGCIADSNGTSLTCFSSTQSVFSFRRILAQAAGLPTSNVDVVAPDVGGAFGLKSNVYPEDLAVVGASLFLRRPVKWAESRRENLLSASHARELTNTIEIGVANDGTILAVKSDLLGDMGVGTTYPYSGVFSIILTAKFFLGTYRIRNYSCRLRGVVTNKAPFGAYRGFGQPEATFFMERMVDIIARALNIDPVEIRLRNMLDKDEMPYQTASGEVYDAGDFKRTLTRALEIVDYAGFKKDQSRSSGNKYRGIGVSVNIESTSPPIPTEDGATVSLARDGSIGVACGVTSIGTSLETLAAKLVADRLGVDLGSVSVTVGDTRKVPYNLGVFGSRSTIVLSVAIGDACKKLEARAIALASEELGVGPEGLRLADGRVSSKDGKLSLTLQDLAGRSPDGKLEASGKFSLPRLITRSGSELPYTGSFTNGAHIATVEVDVETGKVDVLKYVVVHDAGKILLPEVVEGQLIGGVAQGVGGALYEEILYSPEGQLLTSTLMDYIMPGATEMPPVVVEHIETLPELLPVPYKGVGESGTIGGYAAISNAVHDALSGFDVKINDLPLTQEKVLKALGKLQVEP